MDSFAFALSQAKNDTMFKIYSSSQSHKQVPVIFINCSFSLMRRVWAFELNNNKIIHGERKNHSQVKYSINVATL